MVTFEGDVPSWFPYPNEHSARLLSPDTLHIRVGRTNGSGKGTVQGVKVPTSIDVIWFVTKKAGKEVPVAQALRFPTSKWTETAAKKWLSDNKIKFISFEPAKKEGNNISENDLTKNPFIFHQPGLVEFTEDGDSQKEKNNIRLTLYDGSIVKHWFWGNLAFDLSTMKMAKKRNPILFGHDMNQRVAIAEKASFDGAFIMEGRFLKNNKVAQEIRADLEEGFPFESSLKFDPDGSIITKIGEGQSVEVNGKKLHGPGTKIDAFIMEGSICVFGALKNTVSEAFEILEENKQLNERKNIMAETQIEETVAAGEQSATVDIEAVKKQANEEGRARLTALQAAFPDEPKFVLEQFAAGADVAAAKAAFCDILTARNKEFAAKNVELAKKKVDPAVQEFDDKAVPDAASKPTDEKTDEELKKELEASKDLQSEFGEAKNYIAYIKAEKNGQIGTGNSKNDSRHKEVKQEKIFYKKGLL